MRIAAIFIAIYSLYGCGSAPSQNASPSSAKVILGSAQATAASNSGAPDCGFSPLVGQWTISAYDSISFTTGCAINDTLSGLSGGFEQIPGAFVVGTTTCAYSITDLEVTKSAEAFSSTLASCQRTYGNSSTCTRQAMDAQAQAILYYRNKFELVYDCGSGITRAKIQR